jgi:DNA-binding CsgD family transcriptional regulator
MEKDIWLEFRKIFDCISTNEDEMHSSLLQHISSLDSFLQFSPAIVFIIDYSTMQYLYFNEYAGSITEDYVKGGIEFSISNNHPEDNKIVINQIFPYIRNFLSEIQPECYKDYKFSFNFRYKNKDGTYQHFIQHSTYIPDKADNLRYNFAIGNNLPYTDEIKITLTIDKKEKGNYRQISIQTLDITSKSIFTKREIEILKLLYKGMSSSSIAELLCLSGHTVNNHRKNMLKKSETSNTTALIRFVQKKNLL